MCDLPLMVSHQGTVCRNTDDAIEPALAAGALARLQILC
jgi:hypothetical protein